MADFNRQITVLECVQRALLQLGVIITPPSTAVGNTDLTVAQMVGLLHQSGLDLLEDPYKWQALIATQNLTLNSLQTRYDLPDDFAGYFDETAWNESSTQPLVGSISPQTWRLIKARNLGGSTFILQYVIRSNKLEIYTAPSGSESVKIDYMSRGWIQDATDATVFRDYPKNDADIIRYNPSLIVAKLKLAWRRAKGFDTAFVQTEYDDAYARAKGTDSTAPTLSLVPSRGFPYLGYYNIPDSGYGS